MGGLQQSNPNQRWMTVHYALTVGIPSGRVFPESPFGMSTRSTGGGR
jgi:hypothetical protein